MPPRKKGGWPGGRIPRHTRRQVCLLEAAGILLAVLGFLSLLIPALYGGENGQSPCLWYSVTAFALLDLTGTALLFLVYQDAALFTYEDTLKKLRDVPLSPLPCAGREEFQALLLRCRFEEIAPGIFREGFMSPCFRHDRIPHFFAFFESGTPAEACDALPERFNAAFDGRVPGCVFHIFPIVCRQTTTTGEREAFRQLACRHCALSAAGHPSNILPVLLDRAAGQGWYLAGGPWLTSYGYCCRSIKKLKKRMQ